MILGAVFFFNRILILSLLKSIYYNVYMYYFFKANITDEEIHRQAKTIALEMGHFYQVQVRMKRNRKLTK